MPNARDRTIQVFKFLKALNEHRNPAIRQITEQPWRMWLKDLPDHSSIRRSPIPEPTTINAEGGQADITAAAVNDSDFLFRVRRPQLTSSPIPPSLLELWLHDGWQDPFAEVAFNNSINVTNDEDETVLIYFEEDAQRVQAFQSWKNMRDEWAENERPARKAFRIYERLYEVHSRIERESERVELIVGDGLLNWRQIEGGINHPLLLQRLELTFDPPNAEFTITETECEVELYSALLQTLGNVDARLIGQCEKELSDNPCHPLSQASAGFFKSLAIRLAVNGEYIENNELKGEEDHPRIARAPIIFLRNRTMGFAAAIDRVIEDIQRGKELPNSLKRVVGIDSSESNEECKSDTRKSYFEPEEVLFSKPSNSEQFQIAERLSRHSSVLVQGPPGTGKSHTIANIIGHTLAEGKTILVTSHTTKALGVLRKHVVKELQGLCVSVLENDKEGNAQLEDSISEITKDRNPVDLKKDASILDVQRKEILRNLQNIRHKLQEAQNSEYLDIVIGGESYSPSAAAQLVNQKKQADAWLPGPVEAGAVLPLNESEILKLYRTNEALSSEYETLLSGNLPPIEEMINPDAYEALVSEWRRLAAAEKDYGKVLWDGASTSSSDLENLHQRINNAISVINDSKPWTLAALSDAQRGDQYLKPWNELLLLVDNVREQSAAFRENQIRYEPVINLHGQPLNGFQGVVDQIIQHLKKTGKLTQIILALHPQWKRLINFASTVDGSPTTLPHFIAMKQLIAINMKRRELAGRWDRMLGVHGEPMSKTLPEDIENTCLQYRPAIENCINWHKDRWLPAEKSLIDSGFKWETFMSEQPVNPSPFGELIRLRDAVTENLQLILASRCNQLKLEEINEELNKHFKKNREACRNDNANSLFTAFYEILKRRDSIAYRKCYNRLIELQMLKTVFDMRNGLLNRVRPFAPAWADAIRCRKGMHAKSSPPGNAASAWLWRQLNDELDRRGHLALDELQRKVEILEVQLRKATTELVNKKAWFHQSERIGLAEQQALNGWLQLNTRIGKGTGIRAPLLKRAAREAMSKSRNAVPVWIMPLSRVVENFDPRNKRFDVVIIDEASQCDVMGLIAFYLGKKVVVVGDDKQVSPLAIGQNQIFVNNLIRANLQGIPNAALYDGKTSVYHLAQQSAGGKICLQEHFRCAPEIVQFSNGLCYDGSIQPLRDPGSITLKPSVISYKISNGVCENKVNMAEVWLVASLIVAALEQPEYKNKTFGVITLLGDEQAFKIDEILRNNKYLNPAVREAAKVLCGNAAHFQGDQRDVIFLTMVDAPNNSGTPLPLRRDTMFEQRYNVAASRAKDQMWVVHSLDSALDLKDGDLRRRLIEYADDPNSFMRILEKDEKRTESVFEKEVLRRLIQEGYRVLPQWKVGSYRIDLVVEGGGHRLAVECDGDRFHTLDNRDKDMARQAVLERLGWRFVRIRGSNFFRDPESAMKPVFERLEQEGITRRHDESSEGNEDTVGRELKERVNRRAQELRMEWLGKNDFESENQDKNNQKKDKETFKNNDENIGGERDDKKQGQQRNYWQAKHNTNNNKSKESSSPKENFQDKSVAKANDQPSLDLNVKITNRTKVQTSLDYVMSKPSTYWDTFSKWAIENAHFLRDERQLLKNVAERIILGLDIREVEASKVKNLHERAINNLRYESTLSRSK